MTEEYIIKFTDPKSGKVSQIKFTGDKTPTPQDVEEVAKNNRASLQPSVPNVEKMASGDDPLRQGMQETLGSLYGQSMKVRPKRAGVKAFQTTEDPNVSPQRTSRRPMDPLIRYDTETGEPIAPVWWVPAQDYVRLNSLPANGKGVVYHDDKTGTDYGIRSATPDDINKMRQDFPEYKSDDELFNLYGAKDFASDFGPQAAVTAASGGLAGGVVSGGLAATAESEAAKRAAVAGVELTEEAAKKGAGWAANPLVRTLVPMAAGSGASNITDAALHAADQARDPEMAAVQQFIGSEYRRRHPHITTAVEQAPNFALGNPAKWGSGAARLAGAGISGITEFGREQLMGEETDPERIMEHALYGGAAPVEGGAQEWAHKAGSKAVNGVRQLSEPVDFGGGPVLSNDFPEITRDYTRVGEIPAAPQVNPSEIPYTPSASRAFPEASNPLEIASQAGTLLNSTKAGNKAYNQRVKGQQMFPGPVGGSILEQGTRSRVPSDNSLMNMDLTPRIPPMELPGIGDQTVPVQGSMMERQLAQPNGIEDIVGRPGPQAALQNVVDLDPHTVPGLDYVPSATSVDNRFQGLDIDGGVRDVPGGPAAQQRLDALYPQAAPKKAGRKANGATFPETGKKGGQVDSSIGMAGSFGMKHVTLPDGSTAWVPDTNPTPVAQVTRETDPKQELVDYLANSSYLGQMGENPDFNAAYEIHDLSRAGKLNHVHAPDFDILKDVYKQQAEMMGRNGDNLAPMLADRILSNVDPLGEHDPYGRAGHPGWQELKAAATDPNIQKMFGPIEPAGFLAPDVIKHIMAYGGYYKPGSEIPDEQYDYLRAVLRNLYPDGRFDPAMTGLVTHPMTDTITGHFGVVGANPPLVGQYDPNRLYFGDRDISGYGFGSQHDEAPILPLPRDYQKSPYSINPGRPQVLWPTPDAMEQASDFAHGMFANDPNPIENRDENKGRYAEEVLGDYMNKMGLGDGSFGVFNDNAPAKLSRGSSPYDTNSLYVPKKDLVPYIGPVERPGLARLRQLSDEAQQRQLRSVEGYRQAVAEFKAKYGIPSSFVGPFADPIIGSKMLYNAVDAAAQGIKSGLYKSAADVHEFLSDAFNKDIADQNADAVWETASSGRFRPKYAQSRAPQTTSPGTPGGGGFKRSGTKVVRQNRPGRLTPEEAAQIPNHPAVKKFAEDFAANREAYAKFADQMSAERSERLAKAASFAYRKDLSPQERYKGWKNSLGGEHQYLAAATKNNYTDQELSDLFGFIQQSKGASWDNMRAQSAMMKVLSGAKVQPHEANLLADVFGPEFRQMSDRNSSVFHKWMLANSIMKAIRFSADRSAPLNNALQLTLRGLTDGATPQGLKRMFAVSFGNVEKQNQAFGELADEISDMPDVKNGLMEAYGLDLRGMRDPVAGTAPAHQEFFEAAHYFDQLAEMLRENRIGVMDLPKGTAPVMRMLSWLPGEVGASERAFTGYINYMKAQRAQSYFDKLRAAGYDPNKESDKQYFRQAMQVVQHMAGQGNYGKVAGIDLDGQGATALRDMLSAVFNAPRFMVTNMKTTGLPGAVYWGSTIKNAPPAMRKEYAGNMLRGITLGMGALGAYAARGGRVVVDPDNPDYGTVSVGNTRYQVFGPHQPVARMYAAMMKSAAQGNFWGMKKNAPELYQMLQRIPTYPKGSAPFGKGDFAQAPYDFAVNRMNPVLSLALQAGRGRAYGIDPRRSGYNHSPSAVPGLNKMQMEMVKEVLPLAWGDLIDAYQNGSGSVPEKIGDAALAGTGAYFGARVDTPDRISNAKRRVGRKVTRGGVKLQY